MKKDQIKDSINRIKGGIKGEAHPKVYKVQEFFVKRDQILDTKPYSKSLEVNLELYLKGRRERNAKADPGFFVHRKKGGKGKTQRGVQAEKTMRGWRGRGHPWS